MPRKTAVRLWKYWKPTDSIFLLFLCVISGLTQVLGLDESTAVRELVPKYVFFAWSIILLLGAVIALLGNFMYHKNHLPKGLLVEVAGRWMLAPTTLAYAGAVYYYTHNLLNVILLLGFSFACFGRIGEVADKIADWKELAHYGDE